MKDEFVTRSDRIGLGRRAILADMYDVEETMHKKRWVELVERIRPQAGYLQRGDIIQIRESINTLAPDHAREIYDAMDETFIKDALFGVSEYVSTGDNPLGDRLVARDKKGNYLVHDRTVLNFAQWYMGQTLEKQKQLDAEVKELRFEYKNRVRQAIDDGWLPASAIGQLGYTDDVDVLRDDMFATDAAANSARGWYLGEQQPVIALSPLEKPAQTQEEILTHEWTHALSNDHEALYSRFELMSYAFGREGSTILNEAMTEHLAQSLVHGGFDTINPPDRKEEGFYSQYRIFFNKLANAGRVKIDVREFYDALFFSQQEDPDKFYYGDKVQNLMRKIDDAFVGMDVILRLRAIESNDDFQELLSDISLYEMSIAAERNRQDAKIIRNADEFAREIGSMAHAKQDDTTEPPK